MQLTFVFLLLAIVLSLLLYFLFKDRFGVDAFNPSGPGVLKYKNQHIDGYKRQWNQRQDFFQEAMDGTAYLLEWWQQYAESAPDTGQPSVPALLRSGPFQAQRGLNMVKGLESDFLSLIEDESRGGDSRYSAEDYLEAVLFTQDHIYRREDNETANVLDLLKNSHFKYPESVAG